MQQGTGADLRVGHAPHGSAHGQEVALLEGLRVGVTREELAHCQHTVLCIVGLQKHLQAR